MKKYKLIAHPSSPSQAQSLEVSFASREDRLVLKYEVSGDLDQIIFPAEVANPDQKDELWKSTCFEAFISWKGSAVYREYNFSPSLHWAAYQFSSERQRQAYEEKEIPRLARSLNDNFVLQVEFVCPWILEKPDLELGFSAILQTRESGLSYWALKHCSKQPDFHKRESFIASLG